MVKIIAALLLVGLAMVSSLELEFDEIDSLDSYEQFMELRLLAMEFSHHFRNITTADLDMPSTREPSQQDFNCLADMIQLMSGLSSRSMWALKSMYITWTSKYSN